MIKLAVCLSVIVTLLFSSSATLAASLSEAQDAYDRNKVADAGRMFAAIAADPNASADDRADANLALARIAWLIEGDAGAAIRLVGVAQATGAKPCDSGIMLSRVLRESKRY